MSGVSLPGRLSHRSPTARLSVAKTGHGPPLSRLATSIGEMFRLRRRPGPLEVGDIDEAVRHRPQPAQFLSGQ